MDRDRHGNCPGLDSSQLIPKGVGGMQGCITTRHLFTHAGVIVAEFGFRVYFRCLVRTLRNRNGSLTFLECLNDIATYR
jgi:hypothetical protein